MAQYKALQGVTVNGLTFGQNAVLDLDADTAKPFLAEGLIEAVLNSDGSVRGSENEVGTKVEDKAAALEKEAADQAKATDAVGEQGREPVVETDASTADESRV